MKYKILLLSFLSVLIAFIILIASAYGMQNKNKSFYIQKQYTDNEHHINYLIDSMTQFFIRRAYSNIHSEGVINAIKNSNRRELYRLTLPRYQNLLKEIPYLNVMHFHHANGTTLLRMHKKDNYGDNLFDLRQMVQDVHKFKTVRTGFEVGKAGVAYRILVPIIQNNVFLGALEFGVDPEYLLKELYKLEKTQAIIVNRSNGYINTKTENSNKNDLSTLLRNIYLNNSKLTFPIEYNIENKDLIINQYLIDDYSKKSKLSIIYVNDITHITSAKNKVLLIILLATVILLLTIWFIQYYGFNKLIQKLEFKQRYHRMLLDIQPNILIISDEGKKLIDLNKSLLEFSGFSSFNEFKSQYNCICDLFEGSEYEGYLQKDHEDYNWIDHIRTHKNQIHKVKMKNTKDQYRVFQVFVEKIKDEHDKDLYFVVFDDITKLEIQSKIDPLTKLNNRRTFDTVLNYIVLNNKRLEHINSMILLDIDYFKKVNDIHGHQRGDDVLTSLGSLIKNYIRESDMAVRWGGEEFAIFLSNTDLASALVFAEKLRFVIDKENIENLSITCSFGVVEIQHNDTVLSVIHRVDQALYEAKEKGRNRVVCKE